MPKAIKEYQFHSDWFSSRLEEWDRILPYVKARDRVLEIGSFEGQSSCWFLEHILVDQGQLYCIDTWQGNPEFSQFFEQGVIDNAYETFKINIQLAKLPGQRVEVLKGSSVFGLAFLLQDQQSSFDLIYIDGAHDAPSVMTDACMSWPLLKSGGVMVFDDYIWGLEADPRLTPKMAIDFFNLTFQTQFIPLVLGTQYAIKKN